MAVVALGLLAAILYGLGDFAGAYASRHVDVVTVLMYSYPVGALLMIAMLPLFGGELSTHVAVFGVAGGFVGAIGVTTMYALMARAPMNIISPVTAVLAAAVPVVVGVAIGERPHAYAWAGMLIGLVAIVLVSRTGEDHPHGPMAPSVIALALLAGLGFGWYFVFLAKAGSGSGMWPLVISRIASPLIILPIAIARRSFRRLDSRLLPIVILAGVCDASANMFFLLATHTGLLSVASVLTSLYPAVTVILAITLLREHTSPTQRAGLALAGAAIVLLTV